MIAAALEHLMAAYVAAGGDISDLDPATEEDLAAVRNLVAPLRLPADIEYLWRRFQEHGPPGILDTLWLGSVEMAIGAAPYSDLPRALMTIGSGGNERCYLELDDAGGLGGGAVWTHEEFSAELRAVAPSLDALVHANAIAWERGIARLSEQHPFPYALWDEPAWDRLKGEVLPPVRLAGATPTGWPPRWRASEGLGAGDISPQGRTTTIRELTALGAGWTEKETIRGRVRSMVVTLGAEGPTIDDGTGQMAIYVPRAANPFGLLVIRQEAEIDVVPFMPGTQVVPPFDAEAFAGLAVAVREAG